ncbi:MAG: glycosyltransferase family 2 protein [Alphaproteobacteria bacterium]|nr:glycosyltransferase family 2 protein [Alphaproteobacteria bacterium]
MNTPKVSILTPIYNHKVEYVEQCLESLKNQTMQDIEFILIDNGATYESKDLIEKYVNLDSRFRAIHIEENKGYGYAMNLGIDEARGEYVGVVESDDWIEPQMYQDIYTLAKQNNVDIVKGTFNPYYDENENNATYDKVAVPRYPANMYNRILNKEESVLVPTFNPAYWSGLYRKNMLIEKDCYFSLNLGAVCQDATFNLKTWLAAETIYLYRELYYHYRLSNPNSSRYNRLTTAFGDNKECEFLFNWMIKNKNRFTPLEWSYSGKHIYARSFGQLRGRLNPKEISLLSKLKYISFALSPLFKKMLNCKEIPFFNVLKKEEFKSVKLIAQQPLLFFIKEFKLLQKIFSCVNSQDKKRKIITILGIKIKLKRKTKPEEIFLTEIIACRNYIKQKNYLNEMNLSASKLHPKTFANYKNIYNDKELVLFATGPTAKHFSNIKNSVTIGVNRAYLRNDIKLDYLFVASAHDYDDIEDISKINYPLEKFYAILPNDMLRSRENFRSGFIPESTTIRHQAKRFYVKDIADRNISREDLTMTYDIETLPLTCWGSIVSLALQFMFYTNPKKIYLVGCDCTLEPHFYDETKKSNLNLPGIMQGWREVQKFAKDFHPETEVISINPVGLKGMFRDVYTESFLAEHPEIDRKMVEILNEKGEIK